MRIVTGGPKPEHTLADGKGVTDNPIVDTGACTTRDAPPAIDNIFGARQPTANQKNTPTVGRSNLVSGDRMPPQRGRGRAPVFLTAHPGRAAGVHTSTAHLSSMRAAHKYAKVKVDESACPAIFTRTGGVKCIPFDLIIGHPIQGAERRPHRECGCRPQDQLCAAIAKNCSAPRACTHCTRLLSLTQRPPVTSHPNTRFGSTKMDGGF